MFGNFYKGKKVLVTGHTGFKGSWLSFWLEQMGADVYGISLEPDTDPSMFNLCELEKRVNHTILDIRNYDYLVSYIREEQPDIIFHLAAQALVRRSYEIPLETLATNFMGTANLLQAIRNSGYGKNKSCTVIIITSDKCYDNKEHYFAYKETDPMGGKDIYSMSKGATELLVEAWRKSFFPPLKIDEHGVSLASARAGNVIGGGDWADDRLIPDCIRHLIKGKTIQVRNPDAVRPWQHVLEPLSGYLLLGWKLSEGQGKIGQLSSGFNFGPGFESEKSVKYIVEIIIKLWGAGDWNYCSEKDPPPEARLLKLSIDKAFHFLNWRPVWTVDTAMEMTIDWYIEWHKAELDKTTLLNITESQIERFCSDATKLNISWVEST